MYKEMKKYMYDGPVMAFDVCVAHHWSASTYATSERKARSNFAYQFKKQTNKVSSAKITLPGKIKMEGE